MAKQILALDVGEKRIGVAIADLSIKIAIVYDTIETKGTDVLKEIAQIVDMENISKIIVGYPRNQSGEETAQTQYVIDFVKTLETLGIPIEYQDESVTSIQAEKILQDRKKPYKKGDIDALSASIILQDYLELH